MTAEHTPPTDDERRFVHLLEKIMHVASLLLVHPPQPDADAPAPPEGSDEDQASA